MKVRDALMIALSICGGFLGGSIASRPFQVDAAVDSPTKTGRLELVDATGKTRAMLAFDSRTQQPQLTFLNSEGKVLALFGLLSDVSPAMRLIGSDGIVRSTLELTPNQSPILGMGDQGWEGRIVLGAIEGHGASDQKDWALQFRAPGQVPILATIGMLRTSRASLSGVLNVYDSRGRNLVPRQ